MVIHARRASTPGEARRISSGSSAATWSSRRRSRSADDSTTRTREVGPMRRARSVTGSDYVRLGDPEARQATKVGADASMGAGAPTTGWAPDGGTPRMSRSTSRARLAVSAAVTAGLCLTGTAGLVPASQAAPGSCDPAFPVAHLIDGQTVSGLTVTHGTGPTGFSGSIIGVLHDGIEPGVDMVMAKLSSTEIQDNGIWAGMSGSPVYDEGT